MLRTETTVCTLCEAACGLEVEHDGVRISTIRGNERDPLSRGYLCPKGASLGDVQHDPDRVREPLRRRGSSWEPVGWDEALDDIGARLVGIQRRHGSDAIGFYYGNPTGHSYSAGIAALLFREYLGTKNVFTSQSVDALPRLYVSWLLYGNQATLPIPDLERTSFLLMLGANPIVSNGSAMRAPDVKQRLRALRARGGRLVVVDPRRTETADLADSYLAIRPGTDALLLAAVLQTLFAENLAKPPPGVDGIPAIAAKLAHVTPESVASHVGIEARVIRELALDFARAPSAVCYGRMGTCVQELGTLTTWLIDVVNLVTGNLDRPGGAMFPTPAVDLGALARLVRQTGSHGAWKSRVSGHPELMGELPVAAFAEEMETQGPGRVRALVLHAGNPVLSLPNGVRVERALRGLELLVAIDLYKNESTGLADYLLPPTFGLEHDQFPLLSQALAIRNTVSYAPARMAGPPGCRDDYRIFAAIARSMERARGGARGRLGAALVSGLERIGPRRAIDVLLRIGPHRLSLAELERHPNGIDLGPLEPRLARVVAHTSGRIDAAPPPLMAELARIDERLASPATDGGLVLVSRRSLRSNNSWMHNTKKLVTGKPRCTLEMHPSDAAARGLNAGEVVRLASRVGAVHVPLELSARMMPGVVCMPHGFGHDRAGVELSVARAHAGVSVNDVADDALFDGPTRTSALSGVPVTVERRHAAETRT